MSSNASFVTKITNGLNDIRRDLLNEVLVVIKNIEERKGTVDDIKTKVIDMISVGKKVFHDTKPVYKYRVAKLNEESECDSSNEPNPVKAPSNKKVGNESDSDSLKEPTLNKDVDDSHYFISKQQDKRHNDINNKNRERILCQIINDSEFLNADHTRWLSIAVREGVKKYFGNIDNIRCIHKGGRGCHYDFIFIINDTCEFRVEFKFNATCVEELPQIVQPMTSSRFCVGPYGSYEEFFYDNYFVQRCETYNLPLPPKNIYLKQIGNPKPECVKEHKTKYSKGLKLSEGHTDDDIMFYKNCKESSLKSIHTYINETTLNIDKLTEYLLDSQKSKVYMFYKDECISFATIDKDNYIITEIKKEKCMKNLYFVGWNAKTKSGRDLKILLRWKNCLGIAFPSLQISIRK